MSEQNENEDPLAEVDDSEGGRVEGFPTVLDAIPDEILLAAIEQRGLANRRSSYIRWHAPLPPAAMLQQYEDISPGFADRTISASEREQSHRQSGEQTALNASIAAERRGQDMAFAIAILAILLSAALIWTGHTVVGSIFGGITVIGLAAVFITGRWRPNREEATEALEEAAD